MHAAVAALGFDAELVQAALDDLESAPISERLRAALRFLTVFVPPGAEFGEADLQALRAAGVSDEGARDLMLASFCFQNLSRWADAMDWPLIEGEALTATGLGLSKKGYLGCSVGPDVGWTP